MTPFWWGLIAGLLIGGTAGLVIAGLLAAAREDRFWKTKLR